MKKSVFIYIIILITILICSSCVGYLPAIPIRPNISDGKYEAVVTKVYYKTTSGWGGYTTGTLTITIDNELYTLDYDKATLDSTDNLFESAEKGMKLSIEVKDSAVLEWKWELFNDDYN